jgi:hypothetical protein
MPAIPAITEAEAGDYKFKANLGNCQNKNFLKGGEA